MVDPVVELLMKQSASKLSDMLKDVERQILDLQQQQRWIQRAYSEKRGGQQTPASRSGSVARATPADPSPGVDANPWLKTAPAVTDSSQPRRRSGRRRRSVKRERVKEILALSPQAWSNKAIAEGLEDGSSIESVRVLLRRMSDDGEVVKDGDGWRLPSNGSAPNGAAPAGEQTSEAGYGAEAP